ncbi:MAG: hypothetical protein NTV82_02765 [Candidatus Aminicenantes bacterium]|nr:hypothetical protein [Candidatus Aminicenantes bacterium]
MGIGDYLKPNFSDPLEKRTGYGWGWLWLLSYIGGGIMKFEAMPPGMNFALMLICLPPILIVYFLFRKSFIEKKRYGSEIWVNSCVAGMLATIVGLVLIFLVARLFLVTGIKFD